MRTAALALLIFATPGRGEDPTTWISQVLAQDSPATRAEKLEALRLCGTSYRESESGLITSLLFRAASVLFEGNAEIRTAAVKALESVLAHSSNTMYARRLARLADETVEPNPSVRIAVLSALAAMDNSLAHARVFESMKTTSEPEASVREAARQVFAKNPRLAASM